METGMRILNTYMNYSLTRLAIRVGFILAFVFTTNLQVPDVSAEGEQLVVVSSGQGVPAEMTTTQMKTVFKGERQRWKDGTKVIIALMKTTTPVGGSTAKKIYKMSGQQLNKYWLGLVFQGKAKAPKFFTSESDLKSYVSENPGAVGVINITSLGDGKSVLIDGNKSF